MSQLFYHASQAEYSVGRTIQGVTIAEHWRKRELADPGYREVEDLLESARPSAAPSRRNSCFAFGDLADAAAYAQGQVSWTNRGTEREYHYYLVEMERPFSAPLVLVDQAYKKLDSPEMLRAIAAEYWHSGTEWEFLEYLAPTITVKQLVFAPDERELYGAIWRHHEDRELAAKRWP